MGFRFYDELPLRFRAVFGDSAGHPFVYEGPYSQGITAKIRKEYIGSI